LSDIRFIGLFGFFGLVGMIGFFSPVPIQRPGGMVRLLGLIGLLGFSGFCNPWLGACGGFGAFGLWNHERRGFARLAWLGLAGPVGLAVGLAIRYLS
jgi:hypothetical protein